MNWKIIYITRVGCIIDKCLIINIFNIRLHVGDCNFLLRKINNNTKYKICLSVL